jgi:hypothetical protein
VRRLSILLPVLMLVFVLAAAACGGDDGEVTDAPESGALSKSEFADEAGKQCEEATSQIEALPSSGDPTADQYDQIQQIVGGLIGNIDNLVPPDSEQDTVDTMLDGFRKYENAAGKAADDISSGTDAATAEATFNSEAETALQDAADAADDLDISACAELVPSS